jgi:regulator of CtrA degradation
VFSFLDIEWLLSTLFDASLFRLSRAAACGSFFGPARLLTLIERYQRANLRAALSLLHWLQDQRRCPIVARPCARAECKMSDVLMFRAAPEVAPVSFARSFVGSDAFKALFKEGMGLVEETAVYLDGAGREESKLLERDSALTYATESMRLTTRLMQIASWLLVQRAVAEGEITTDQARTEKNRVRIADSGPVTAAEALEKLPSRLQEIVATSIRLQERILHLEGLMSAKPEAEADETENPVANQIAMLKGLLQGRR